MNWPLWKRELWGKNWVRLVVLLATSALAILIVQWIRGPSIEARRISISWFCMGLFQLDQGIWLLSTRLAQGLPLSRILPATDIVAPLVAHAAIGICSALLVSLHLTPRVHRELSEWGMTAIDGGEVALAMCARAFLLLWFALAVFVLSDCAMWSDAHDFTFPLRYTGHSYGFVPAYPEMSSLFLTRMGWLGLSVELIVRMGVLAFLAVTMALLVFSRFSHRFAWAFPCAALAATLLVTAPEILRRAHLAISPPAPVTGGMDFGALVLRRIYDAPAQQPKWLGFDQESLEELRHVENMWRGVDGMSPSALPEGLQSLRRRQGDEMASIWISNLVVGVLWLLLWLWWAKRFFLRSFLRE